jgi:hypothetical protein
MAFLPARLPQAMRLSRSSVMRVSSRLDPAKPHPQGVACCLSTTPFRGWFIRMNRHHSWFPVHTYELEEDRLSSLPPAVFGSSPVVRTFFAGPNRVLFSVFRSHLFDDRCDALPRESALFDVLQFIRMNSDGKDRPVHTYELGSGSPAEASGQRRADSRRCSECSKAQAAEDYASDSSTDVDGGFMPDDWLLSQFIRMNLGGKCRLVHMYELGDGSRIESSGLATLCSPQPERSAVQAAEDYKSGLSTVVDGGFMPHGWLSSQFIRMNSGGMRRPVHTYELGVGSRIESSGQAALCPPQSERSAAQAAKDYTSSSSTIVDGGFMRHGSLSSQFIRMNRSSAQLPYEQAFGNEFEPESDSGSRCANFVLDAASSESDEASSAIWGRRTGRTQHVPKTTRKLPVHTYEFGSPPPGFAYSCAGAQFIRINHGPGGTCTLPTLMVHTYEPSTRARMPNLPPSASALPPPEPRHRAGFGVSGVHVLEIRPMT